ncbi:uncharacterized protein LOC106650276 [Trichogramma pretiosum]|uniref:uncharacterized protein LOC106650276 n=1 Tax=Trichogramma pretiosum TaxID=7493 RepID=UPI0006C99832|nr:uncharacterized protein LOC106650276 [Trichogramma pretiosum]
MANSALLLGQLLATSLLMILAGLSTHQQGALGQLDSEYRLHQTISNFAKRKKEQKQDLAKIPGIPWQDYPLYHEIPQTSFSCAHVPAVPGMYANVETGCQVYHVCHDGREGDQGAAFLCANGTIFNQKEFACDWWYNVDCGSAPRLYELNLDPETNPYVPPAHKEQIRQDRLKAFI